MSNDTCRDCLAPFDSSGNAASRNKTCYKCQQEGHVGLSVFLKSSSYLFHFIDCQRLSRKSQFRGLRISICLLLLVQNIFVVYDFLAIHSYVSLKHSALIRGNAWLSS